MFACNVRSVFVSGGLWLGQYERGFRVTRKLAAKEFGRTDEHRRRILAAADLDELHKLLQQDFWYVSM